MTTIEQVRLTALPARGHVRVHRRGRDTGRACTSRTRPARLTRSRPGGAPLCYLSAGVLMSRASHRPRPITPATTVALALLAALITVWLGLVAHFGAAAADTGAAVPAQLGVVRVQAGEGLQQLAARVAPGAPAGQVVDRIRELNGLDSAALDAGQTLIAPIG